MFFVFTLLDDKQRFAFTLAKYPALFTLICLDYWFFCLSLWRFGNDSGIRFFNALLLHPGIIVDDRISDDVD